MLKFYLCVRSVILGFIKILTELFVQLFLKRRGKTIPRKNYLHHWVFFQSRKICEFRAVTIEILLYLPDTSRFYLTRGICNVEMFRLLQNTVVIHIAYSFILCKAFFFTFILPKNFAGTWQGAGVKTTGMKAEFIIKLLVSFLKKYELNSYVFCVVLCLFWKIMSHQVAFLQRVKFLELP